MVLLSAWTQRNTAAQRGSLKEPFVRRTREASADVVDLECSTLRLGEHRTKGLHTLRHCYLNALEKFPENYQRHCSRRRSPSERHPNAIYRAVIAGKPDTLLL